MNQDKFIKLIRNSNIVSKKETIALETIVEEFPYFQTARVLHLKGLKNQNSFKYNKTLKKVAAYTTNRTILFDFITTNSLDFEKTSKSEKEILNEIDVIDSKVLNHLHKSIVASKRKDDMIKELNQIENLSLIDKVEKIDEKNTGKQEIIEVTKIKEELKSQNEILEINKPINFQKEDTFSFNEWLQLKPIKPVKRLSTDSNKIEKHHLDQKDKLAIGKNVAIQPQNVAKNSDLIAAFIKNKPKIKPIKNQENKDITTNSTLENSNLMTETLARVYLEQKKYKKAIAAFKILSLKYPEKSSFFADRIKAIQFLEKHKS